MSGIYGAFYLSLGQFTLNVKFNFPNQGITAISGHSGCGKTTFLRCLAGITKAKHGFCQFNNQSLQDSKNNFFLPPKERHVGLIFQETYLFPHLSIGANLLYGFKRTPRNERKIQYEQVIQALKIDKLLDQTTNSLSGGQKQRIAIARSLLTSPLLLLLDEPINALDVDAKYDILSYLKLLSQEFSMPMLYVTHANDEINKFVDYQIYMDNGQFTSFQPYSCALKMQINTRYV